MNNEIIRLFLVIILSIGIFTVWNYIRPDLNIKNNTSDAKSIKKIEILKNEKVTNNDNKELPIGIITTPIYNLFKKINKRIDNLGLSIILMTFILKILTLPLTILSNKSSSKMKAFQEELEIFKKNKSISHEQIAKKTMELMKKHKVNPLKGFLTMLIQVPLFFSFFAVLQKAPEFDGASFMGFINNLSLPDPFYILPIISVIAVSLQMLLSQSGGNKKLLLIISAASLIFMINLPSAVQIYILVSSLLAIIFQVLLNLKNYKLNYQE